MQATRIVALELSSVAVSDDRVSLTIASDPIELPPPLGHAIVELMHASASKSNRWMFPGRNPGAHLTTTALARGLRRLGIPLVDARATALLQLSQHMHPRIVSDLLGLSVTAAARWWRLASGDWTSYPSLR